MQWMRRHKLKIIIGFCFMMAFPVLWYIGPALYDQYAPATSTEKEQWSQVKALYEAYPPERNSNDFIEFTKNRDSNKLQEWVNFNKNYAERLNTIRSTDIFSSKTRVTRYIDLYIQQIELASIAGTGFAAAYKSNTGYDNEYTKSVIDFTFRKVSNQRNKANDTEFDKLQIFIIKNFL